MEMIVKGMKGNPNAKYVHLDIEEVIAFQIVS